MALSTHAKQEIFQLSGWDLSDLLPADPKANGSGATPSETAIEERLAQVEEDVTAFEALREELSAQMEPDKLLSAVQQYENITAQLYRLEAYGSLWFSSDTQSPDTLTYTNRMQQVVTEIQNRMLFFSLWWKGLDDEHAKVLLPDADAYPDYRHFLQEIRLFKPHMLEEEAERIINVKDANGMKAVITIYSMLTNRLEFELEVDGETKRMTRGEVMAYVYSSDPDMRAAAYQSIHKVYKEEAPILAQIYINRVRDWHNENVTLRSFDSPIAVRNLTNDVPHEAVDALLEVARRNAPLFQRYFSLQGPNGWAWKSCAATKSTRLWQALRARSPMKTRSSLCWTPSSASTWIFAGKAQRVFDDNPIDSAVRKGKRSGAFCATVLPSITPYVLVNYTK